MNKFNFRLITSYLITILLISHYTLMANEIYSTNNIPDLYKKVEVFKEGGNYKEAIDIMEKIEKFQDNYYVCIELGRLYRLNNNLKNAKKAYIRSLEFIPDSFDVNLELIETLIGLKDFIGAEELAIKLSKEYPNHYLIKKIISDIKLLKDKYSWKYNIEAYATFGKLDSPWMKDKFYGPSFILGAKHPSGFGLSFNISYSLISFVYEKDDCKETLIGSGIFYEGLSSKYWFHYSHVSDNFENQGDIFSIYAGYGFNKIGIGLSYDLGLYNGFNTYQAEPLISYNISNSIKLIFAPTIQLFSGDFPTNNDEMLYSLRTGASFNTNNFFTSLIYIYGSRFFPVENNGLIIRNCDEKLSYGIRFNAGFFTDRKLYPVILFNYDKIEEQLGVKRNTNVMCFTLGCVFNF
ncbi:MAG: hypothetical protein HQK76_14060 [Desulfobacterales bacterium]|nr:hypothetical protein [Desulfobacterales bacterium]